MCYYNGTELIKGLPKCEQFQGQAGVQKCKCKENYDGNLCDQCKEGKNCERKSTNFTAYPDIVQCTDLFAQIPFKVFGPNANKQAKIELVYCYSYI